MSTSNAASTKRIALRAASQVEALAPIFEKWNVTAGKTDANKKFAKIVADKWPALRQMNQEIFFEMDDNGNTLFERNVDRNSSGANYREFFVEYATASESVANMLELSIACPNGKNVSKMLLKCWTRLSMLVTGNHVVGDKPLFHLGAYHFFTEEPQPSVCVLQ